MKKLLGLIVAVSVLAASSMSAFAELKTVADEVDGVKTGAYTTYSTAQEAGANAMVTLLVVNGDLSNVDVNTIQYIDQSVADANGDFTFASYIPKEAPGIGVTYNVYVGGTNFTAARTAETIPGPEIVNPSTVTFAGTISKVGTRTSAILTLTNDAIAEPIIIEADASTGAFTAEIPAGTYLVTVSKPGHLAPTAAELSILESITNKTYALRAGDANASGDINITDISAILASFGTSEGNETYMANRDVNDTGDINITDISATLASFGLSASDLIN